MMKFFLRARIGIFVAITGMLFYPTTYAEDIEASDYQEVEWTQLMPAEDLAALLNPPDYLAGIEDGSQEDSVIIYVSIEQGVELESLYDPFWFEGTLAIDTTENAMGTAAYRLEHVNVKPYEG